MDDLNNFFDAPLTTDQTAPEVEQVETPTETETAQPEAVETETPAETPEEPAAETTTEERPANPNWVPVSALTAERNKAREKEQEVERLRGELARFQQAPATQAPVHQTPATPQTLSEQGIPDPIDDPAAYHQFVLAQARQEIATQHVVHSRIRAEQKHGAEFVQEVAVWAVNHAKQNPAFEQQMLVQPDPAEWVIEQKKRFDLTNSFATDPDAYVRQRAAELGFVAVAPSAAAAPLTPAVKDTGPASLVTAKSNTEAVFPKQAAKDSFDAIFSRK